MSKAAPPVFFFAFADPGEQSTVALPALRNEEAGIRAALATGALDGSWEFVSGTEMKRADLIDTFRNNRVAIFHFGGHSNQQSLWLPNEAAGNQVMDGTLFEEFLSTQPSLQLAFFNSCENQAWASKLAKHVPYVIASVCKLDDAIASDFAEAFYKYLAQGSTVDDAFQQAAGDVMGKQEHEQSLGEWVQKYKQQPPQFRTFDEAEDFPTPAQATFPWVAVKRANAAGAGSWRLADAAHDPLIGLPPLDPESFDLPERPYVTIKGHGERDAALFFGRSAEIRALADWTLSANDRPISLLYGQSGVGKSSLLNAGLLPRLRKKCRVAYRRRNRNLMDDLYSAMGELLGSQPPVANTAAWQASQASAWTSLAEPSLIILDQVEEAITHAVGAGNAIGEELRAFAAHVRGIFSGCAANCPARLLLCFRKEYLAEIRGYFAEGSTDNAPELLDHFWLDRLEHDAIAEVVTGAAESRLTRDKYKIVFPEDDRLPNLIAGDLLKGDSPIATVLEIVLNQLWDAAKPDANGVRSYTVALYENLAIRGNPLEGFYEQQLASLYGESEGKEAAQGLELDLLYGHTSELGTSLRRSLDDLRKDYPKLADLDQLLTANKDRYLLTEPASDPGGTQSANNHSTALAHDTLAPLIRRDFALSVLPGARARRLLENRAREWAGKRKGTVLDRADLRTVERGLPHMRAVTEDEQRLISASRRQNLRSSAGVIAAIVLLPLLLIGSIVGMVVQESNKEQEALRLSSIAKLGGNQIVAIAEALEAERIHEYTWQMHLDPLKDRGEYAKAAFNLMQETLQYREVYRAAIDPRMLYLGSCVTALKNGHPLITMDQKGNSYFAGKQLPSFEPNHVDCDPTSGTLAIQKVGQNNTIQIWHAGNTQTVNLPVSMEKDAGLALKPGGSAVAYGTANGLALLNLSTGTVSQYPGIKVIPNIVFSPSGRYLVQGLEDKGFGFIDLNQPNPHLTSITGKPIETFTVARVHGQEAVAFAGKGLLQIYRLSDGKLFDLMEGTEEDRTFEGIALAPDGKLLGAYTEGQIGLFAVPPTLEPISNGSMGSIDPALLSLHQGPHMGGPATYLDEMDVPNGFLNTQYIPKGADIVVSAEIDLGAPGRDENYGETRPQTALLHIWKVSPHAKKEATNKVPEGLFGMGCNLIANFIDDMAANPATMFGTENIDYPALKKECSKRRAGR